MNQRIKSTIDTQGWKDILIIFKEEQDKMCDNRRINITSAIEFGRTAMAGAKASELIDKVLKRIERETQDIKSKKISYK